MVEGVVYSSWIANGIHELDTCCKNTNVKSIVIEDDLFQFIDVLMYICMEVCIKTMPY